MAHTQTTCNVKHSLPNIWKCKMCSSSCVAWWGVETRTSNWTVRPWGQNTFSNIILYFYCLNPKDINQQARVLPGSSQDQLLSWFRKTKDLHTFVCDVCVTEFLTLWIRWGKWWIWSTWVCWGHGACCCKTSSSFACSRRERT